MRPLESTPRRIIQLCGYKLNPGKKLEHQRQETRTNKGSALMKMQQKFAMLTAKDKQLDCLKLAVGLVFGFQGKPDQVGQPLS